MENHNYEKLRDFDLACSDIDLLTTFYERATCYTALLWTTVRFVKNPNTDAKRRDGWYCLDCLADGLTKLRREILRRELFNECPSVWLNVEAAAREDLMRLFDTAEAPLH